MLDKIFETYDSVVYFDTETTGLDPASCQIIELAAIQYDKFGSKQRMDALIKLPEGEKLPEKITELTHITDEMLETDGVTIDEAMNQFNLMFAGKTLVVAYNIQFDLNFVFETALKKCPEIVRDLMNADYLDALTVFKDRRLFPHKLCNAIEAYSLQDMAENSHRAIDDVIALYWVTAKMDAEREDLAEYINTFGYNPKYGITGREIKGVTYKAQPYRKGNDMVAEDEILPLAG